MSPRVALHPALPSRGKMGTSRVTGSSGSTHSIASPHKCFCYFVHICVITLPGTEHNKAAASSGLVHSQLFVVASSGDSKFTSWSDFG